MQSPTALLDVATRLSLSLWLQRLVDSLIVQADCFAGVRPKTIRYLSRLKEARTSDNADDHRLHLSAPHGKFTSTTQPLQVIIARAANRSRSALKAAMPDAREA